MQKTKTQSAKKIEAPEGGAVEISVMNYIGIAADELLRIERHSKRTDVEMPLVEAGWTESMCRDWCEENDLLSPIYTTSSRGGCWFCHNQPIDQLRLLRRNYPEYWALMMKWDLDSPCSFTPNGRTIHDFDKRFRMEELGLLEGKPFRWALVDNTQIE